MLNTASPAISFRQDIVQSVIAEALPGLGDRSRRIKVKMLDEKYQHEIEKSVADTASVVMYAKVIDSDVKFESLLAEITPSKDSDILALCQSLVTASADDSDSENALTSCISPEQLDRRLNSISRHLQA